MMSRIKSAALTMVMAAMIVGGAAPLMAQNGAGGSLTIGSQPAAAPTYVPPPIPYPYYPYLGLKLDNRTPKQRCWDSESVRAGSPLSDLDRRAIDLKCSQR
jgi:hypothetical protein